jgi:dGTPase
MSGVETRSDNQGRVGVDGRPGAGADAGAGDGAVARQERWAATMAGHPGAHVRLAHADSAARVEGVGPLWREEREALEARFLSRSATRSSAAGHRVVDEAPDPMRTCFERDRDRILHANAFRRLAGKTQVFVFPDDHQRTRLTHALEVAQVAGALARTLRLNEALTEAIALGHDCGHGPGGHASEDALSPYVAGGYDHACWGADVVLAPLNLCAETLDGVRNHSWSRPAPSTPEGEVVSWADRIAYVCHDLEDAVAAGIVTLQMMPAMVRERCGTTRRDQIGAFIAAMEAASVASGRVGMAGEAADALAELRQFNYEHIYLRPASVRQAEAVIGLLRALVECYADRPNLLPSERAAGVDAGSDDARRVAVTYVSGMTDRFACQQALALLGWDRSQLPRGVDTMW